jgi:hypothetical protein
MDTGDIIALKLRFSRAVGDVKVKLLSDVSETLCLCHQGLI